MLTKKTLTMAVVIVWAVLMSTFSWAVPQNINFQGKVTDNLGECVDGPYDMTFSLFTVDNGGSASWSELQNVIVANCTYDVQLGSEDPFPAGLFDNDNLYLEVAIYNPDTTSWETLSPRQQLTSTAYAMMSEKSDDSDTLDGLDSSQFAGDVHNHTFSDVTGSASDAQVPNNITINYAAEAGNADTVDGQHASAFASTVHNHGFPDITGTVTDAQVPNTITINYSLNADRLDGLDSSAFLSSANDWGRLNVSSNLYEGSSTLTSKYVNEGQSNSITSAMIVNSTITASDLAANSVGSSEIATGAVGTSEILWSLNHEGADLNGGLISLTNTSNGSNGNYPVGVYGATKGNPNGNTVIGVFGGAPGFGQGGPFGALPKDKIGVAGLSDTGYGVAGVTSGSSSHAGYFASTAGVGLAGAALKAQNSKSNGIAIWGINMGSTDTTAVFENHGSGYLVKGFGGDGGEHEFAVHNNGKVWTEGGVQVVGNARVVTPVLEITGGSDLSERFKIKGVKGDSLPSPGMVVSIDPENPGNLTVSTESYDRKVAGVISGAGGVKPGMLMGQKGTAADGSDPVALTGRVYTWVDASYGPIEPGTLLTTSNSPGYAMGVADHNKAQGAILGKAMSSLQEGKGLVLVLVSLQ